MYNLPGLDAWIVLYHIAHLSALEFVAEPPLFFSWCAAYCSRAYFIEYLKVRYCNKYLVVYLCIHGACMPVVLKLCCLKQSN